MEPVEKPYQISFFGKTNLKNNKFIILNETGYYPGDFRSKIINKILKCTISSNPIIVFNEKNEYFIVCDTDDIRDIFKEWINIDSSIMLKIISIKPSLFTFTEHKNTMVNIAIPSNDTFKSILQSMENTSNFDSPNFGSITNTAEVFSNTAGVGSIPNFSSITNTVGIGSIPNFSSITNTDGVFSHTSSGSIPNFSSISNTAGIDSNTSITNTAGIGSIPNFSSITNTFSTSSNSSITSISKSSNINMSTNTSKKFPLNVNAPAFVPKAIRNFKI